VFVSHVC